MSELGDFYFVNGQPHVDFEYDDEEYYLNWGNTHIFLHFEPYQQVDHLFYKEFDDEGVATSGILMFRQTIDDFNKVATQLIKQKYPYTKAPLPAEIDENMWVELNTEDLYDEK